MRTTVVSVYLRGRCDPLTAGGQGSFVLGFIRLSDSGTCSQVAVCLQAALTSGRRALTGEDFLQTPRAGFDLTNTSPCRDTYIKICELLRQRGSSGEGEVAHNKRGIEIREGEKTMEAMNKD